MAKSRRSSSGGMTCIRITLILFNLLTLLAGVATMSIGLLLFFSSNQSESENGMDILSDVSADAADSNVLIPRFHGEFRGFSVVLIALGTLVSFISFLGCFGACVNSKCLLIAYLISVGLILSLQFLVSVFAIIYRQPMSSTARTELTNHIKHTYRPDSDDAQTWGIIHQTFGCCGIDGFSDWFGIDAWPGQQFVPDSCCLNSTIVGCGKEIDPSLWYKHGCLGNIQFTMMEKLHYLASAIITLVFLQLYGIIASTLLYYHVKEIPKHSHTFKPYSYEMSRRAK